MVKIECFKETFYSSSNDDAVGILIMLKDGLLNEMKLYQSQYISGYAYYGEYPLAFATCFGWMDIYDYLVDNGADPNKQDSFGNTCLHMAVIADTAVSET